MTTKAKITAVSIGAGIIIGAVIGYLIADTLFAYILITALALGGAGYLAALMIAVLIDTKNESRSYPVPDPFDTSYEE
jgi:urea transporter